MEEPLFHVSPHLYKGSLYHPCKDFAVFIDYPWLILRNQQSMACKEITIKVTWLFCEVIVNTNS